MKYLITIFVFAFLVTVIYLIAYGFPLLLKIKENKRKRLWKERQKRKEENESKIKNLDLKLRGRGEIEAYLSLNRFNLPEDAKWKSLLPDMIKDLLVIGWTTEMPLYVKYKYGSYEFHISTTQQDTINKAIPIFNKYLDLSRFTN